jgi:hypothetical protein
MRKEYQFYLNNRSVLIKRHLNKFVVIKGKKLIASYATYDIALSESEKSFPPGTFLIQHCTATQSLVD